MKYRKLLLLLPILILILFFLMLNYRILKINKINCLNQYGECDEILISNLKSSEGKSFHDAKRQVENTLNSENLIEGYSIQYSFPDKLDINVIIKKPKFAIKSLNSEQFALVDKNGQAVGIVQSSNLPTLLIEGSVPNVGEKVSQEVLFSLNILYDLFYLYQIRFATLSAEGLTVEMPDGILVLFPRQGDRQVLIGAMNLILARIDQEDKFKIVDLRFKDPILRQTL